MKKRISIIIMTILMMCAAVVPVAAASYSSSYSVKASKTLSKNVGIGAAYHYFVKGGVTSADYVAFAKGGLGSTHEMTVTLSITTSDGKTNKKTYKNYFAGGNNLQEDIPRAKTVTKGTLWKAATKTSAYYKDVYSTTGVNTWTVTGK